jgi:hypothetical protein
MTVNNLEFGDVLSLSKGIFKFEISLQGNERSKSKNYSIPEILNFLKKGSARGH